MNNIIIAIINYNTNDYTNNCIKSILDKCSLKNYKILVFDNSDKINFDNIYKVDVIDNTESKIIDFSEYLKNAKEYTLNNYGSAKHTITIDYMIKKIGVDNILLFDSDTILLRDIDFIDVKYITIADLISTTYSRFYNRRFLPFIQYFNCKKINDHKLDYYDKNRMLGVSKNDYLYDTGSSFYEDVLKLDSEFKRIKYKDYIIHYGRKSWDPEHKLKRK